MTELVQGGDYPVVALLGDGPPVPECETISQVGVLLVDDQEYVCLTLESALREAGFGCYTETQLRDMGAGAVLYKPVRMEKIAEVVRLLAGPAGASQGLGEGLVATTARRSPSRGAPFQLGAARGAAFLNPIRLESNP